MTDYTPTTHTIREAYVKFQSDLDRLTGKQQPADVYYTEFDRWLEQVKTEGTDPNTPERFHPGGWIDEKGQPKYQHRRTTRM